MNIQDDKSEICRIASEAIDVADLYLQAARRTEDPGLGDCLEHRSRQRRRMSAALLARAGVDQEGEAPGSVLPTPQEVWLRLKSFAAGPDHAALSTIRAADDQLLTIINDYLNHSTPSTQAAAAAQWLRDQLVQERGATNDRDPTPDRQPG